VKCQGRLHLHAAQYTQNTSGLREMTKQKEKCINDSV